MTDEHQTARLEFSKQFHEYIMRPDPTHWLPPREIDERIKLIRALEASEQRARLAKFGIVCTVLGFILGYFTWGIWPVSGLVYRLFTECFL